MTETTHCPFCGCPAPSQTRPAGWDGAIESLYREVRRIRELAEDHGAADHGAADAERRIAALTREVGELRATVARLRAVAAPGPARPALSPQRPGTKTDFGRR